MPLKITHLALNCLIVVIDHYMDILSIRGWHTVKNFSGILHCQTRDVKWPSLDSVKLRMQWKLQTFRKFLSLIVKLHLVVNFMNCYCIISNFGHNYT